MGRLSFRFPMEGAEELCLLLGSTAVALARGDSRRREPSERIESTELIV